MELFSVTRILSHVHILAGKIGPRGTGTTGEALAAEFVAERLTELKLSFERYTLKTVPSQNVFPLAIDGLALLAILVYPLGGMPSRWIAACLAMSTAPLLWHTIRYSDNPLRPLLPKVASQSIVARVQPQGQLRQRAVILAHLDTNRCRMAWQSMAVRRLELLTCLTLVVLASLGVLYLAGALLNGPSWLWWLSLLPAAYVVGTIITLGKDDHTPYTPGAHDNAASVAVALELAACLAKQPLLSTEVWLAFTGAEETDHAGLYALLRKHNSILRQAVFIGLEGVGSGEIVYLTRQGVISHYAPDPDLLALVKGLAERLPELGVHAAQMVIEDEVGTLRRKGYRAICIAGRDPQTGVLPHWHRADDTVETVSAEAMERAVRFVTALLEEIDHQALAGQS